MTEQQHNTLLSIQLKDEVFAIDAMKVNHILEMPEITGVPNTPDFMKGIINLHGNILPVVDLRLMMGFGASERTNDTAIVVISPDNNQDSSIGLIVDMVREVIEAEGLEMKPTVMGNDESLIKNFLGTFTLNDQFVHLIDLDELVSVAEI